MESEKEMAVLRMRLVAGYFLVLLSTIAVALPFLHEPLPEAR